MDIENVKQKYRALDMELTGSQNLSDTLAMLYHENSKVNKSISRRQFPQIKLFSNPFVIKKASKPYKNYFSEKTYALDIYKGTSPKRDFFEIIRSRHSSRKFLKSYKISLMELQKILYCSYGITSTSQMNGEESSTWSKRHVPSAGGLYPLEIYVVIINGAIEQGVYHYNSGNNSLALIKEGDFTEYLKEYSGSNNWIDLDTVSCLIMTSSILERQIIKYGERAYRFVLMETGFVAQNMSLVCESLDLGSCMLGFFYDDKLNELLGINGFGETVQNVLVVGKEERESEKAE
ncbi:SagB/ThcOx family dehydrogenase [Maribacter sp. IgM3_T14_3]|uniref:SagB/ThcOx family dehydrogenase n=1 Tax=Maribacter sp. IgM3_T14_3 TaxID=3415140 RepID=UPI003C6F5254